MAFGTDVFVEELQLIDLTGDDRPELFVSWAVNSLYGEVFRLSGTTWDLIGGGEYVKLNDGRLLGQENVCRPDCARGFNVAFELLWDGAEFRTEYLDWTGQPIDLTVPVSCSTYTERAYPGPYRPCDKGDGVALIQEALVYWGFMEREQSPGTTSIDGLFGQKTADAVRLAQYYFGYPVDGVVSSDFYTGPFIDYLNGFEKPPEPRF